MPYDYQGFRGIGQGIGQGVSSYFATKTQRLKQELEGKEKEEQNLAKAMKIMKDLGLEDSPRFREIGMQRLSGLVPGFEAQQQGMPAPMPLKRMPPSQVESRTEIVGQRAKESLRLGETREKEEKATLRKRAEQLMKQRRDFLRGDPIMTALGGLIEPQWSDETEGVELNNILSDLRTKHRFTYPKSVMDALKIPSQTLGSLKPLQGPTTTGATLDTLKTDPLGLFK